VSAPYATQQADREKILAGLEWLEGQSRSQFGSGFAAATPDEREQLVDTIAAPQAEASTLSPQAEFFDRFRYLAVGAYYTTEAGIGDIGYVGNVAISGEYPGPGDEALAHLAGVLETLGLSLQMPGDTA
jgi:hypothetical protein